MDFTLLADNTPDPEHRLESEHGLSIYLEIDGKRWLLDVGASDLFARNAEKLGIDLSEVDFLILSHAHADHTGGLRAFLERNTKARIFLSSHIDGRRFISTRHNAPHDISIDYSLLDEHHDRFMFLCADLAVTPSVYIHTPIPHLYPAVRANATLKADDEPDDFSHEMAVEIRDGNHGIMLSACSHLGLFNTLSTARGEISTYIGGLHLVDSDPTHHFESEAEIREMGKMLQSTHPRLYVCSGHCTGAHAAAILQDVLGDRFRLFYTGYTIHTA